MATELGKAYVQIMPSARGIKGSIQGILDPEAETAGKSAGEKAGSSIVSTIKKVVVAAGIGKFLKESLFEGGALQQSIGGIETLFKDSADIVKAYAQDAYKTAGLSANEYMEQTTSFAASLLQSVSGDTEKAAEYAHMAMVDMSDNINKFGTDADSVHRAYQGFARQQYMMLDNLKLGYAGTKSEMERLLKDAQKISGVEYNIENLADVYEAIHVIQEELGVTGTTALEAEETLTGSFAAMKGALKNVLGALSLGEGLAPALTGLADTVSVFLFNNLIPMIITILQTLPGAIFQFIQLSAPRFMESGSQLLTSIIEGIGSGLPVLLEKVKEIMANVVVWIQEEFPSFVQKGIETIVNLARGMFKNLPSLLNTVGEILALVLTAILDAIPSMIIGGIKLIAGVAKGLWDNRSEITQALKNVLSSLIAVIDGKITEFVTIGANLVKGLWRGISSVKDWILSKISGFVDSIVSGIKRFFGIASPSKVFAKIGEQLDEGLAKGIVDNTKSITQAMDNVAKLTTRSFESEVAITASAASLKSADVSAVDNSSENLKRMLTDAFYTALIMYKPSIEVDKRELARLVAAL